MHGSWRVNCVLKQSNFLGIHSFSALTLSSFTLPPWLPPLFLRSTAKTFPGQVAFLSHCFGYLCFHLPTQFYNFYLPQIWKSFVHCWSCPDSAIIGLYIFFYSFIFFYKISGEKEGSSCVWCNVYKHNFHKDLWNLSNKTSYT